MSTQQDIYAVSSENHPYMLNKENYVPWSSRLLRYAKSRPNGKLIYNFIINGPYVRRMIPKQGDQNREVPVNETFHEQTDDELTKKELEQVEADFQAIQTILLGLLEDIYATVDSCENAQEIWLHVQQMLKGSDIRIQDKKAKLLNEWEMFTSTDGESIKSYYHHFSKLINGFKRNKHFLEKIAIQNVRNQVVQNAVQNPDVQNVRNQNGLIVVSGFANQNPNGNGNVVAARAEGNLLIAQKEEAGLQLEAEEFNLMAAASDLDETEEVDANCILMANLQQASTLGTQTGKAPVYASDASVENDGNVISDASSVEQDRGTVDQHPATAEETRAYFESLYNNLAIEVEKVSKQMDTTKGFPKVGESNDLSKPVTSNSTPSSRESTVVNNERVIAPGIFRINPSKASRDQKTRPRNNLKDDKVSSKSKSNCLLNKLEKIEENHRSLQSSNYPDHTSSECNDIKLALRNGNYEVIYATWFPAQSVGSSNTKVLDSPCLLVLITGTSQSSQHESCKSPTKSLFDVGLSRISIFTNDLLLALDSLPPVQYQRSRSEMSIDNV
nr:hypothetical protein [Tanacetum cinerariifolium]